jgi:hypothetical protein
MTTHARRTRRPLAALSLTALAVLAGCGGGDDGGGSRADRLAACLDKTEARASTAESTLEGATGAVEMLGPSAVVHVFENEAAAKKYAAEETLGTPTVIGSLGVSSTDPKAIELVRGCASA